MVREKSLRIIKAQISPRWGVGIKADSIVRFYESLIFTAKFNHVLKNKFLQPEDLTLAEGTAVPLHGRLSLGPVIIDYVSIQ